LDFISLPDTIPGMNAPVVRARARVGGRMFDAFRPPELIRHLLPDALNRLRDM
jgi:hypothetical protein